MTTEKAQTVLHAETCDHRPFVGQVRSKHLQEYVDAVRAVTDECRVHIGEEGWHTEAVDPANVSMVGADLPASVFDGYEADPIEIGLPAYQLDKVLDHIGGDGHLRLAYEAADDELVIEADKQYYQLSLLDPGNLRTEPNIPGLDLTTAVAIDAATLREMVEYFDAVTDRVTLGYDHSDEFLWFEADDSVGNGDDKAGARFDRDELAAVESTDDAESRFSLDYFADLMEPIPGDREVTMHIGEEFPMRLEWGSAYEHTESGGEYHATVEFVQAPRIQS